MCLSWYSGLVWLLHRSYASWFVFRLHIRSATPNSWNDGAQPDPETPLPMEAWTHVAFAHSEGLFAVSILLCLCPEMAIGSFGCLPLRRGRYSSTASKFPNRPISGDLSSTTVGPHVRLCASPRFSMCLAWFAWECWPAGSLYASLDAPALVDLADIRYYPRIATNEEIVDVVDQARYRQ